MVSRRTSLCGFFIILAELSHVKFGESNCDRSLSPKFGPCFPSCSQLCSKSEANLLRTTLSLAFLFNFVDCGGEQFALPFCVIFAPCVPKCGVVLQRFGASAAAPPRRFPTNARTVPLTAPSTIMTATRTMVTNEPRRHHSFESECTSVDLRLLCFLISP